MIKRGYVLDIDSPVSGGFALLTVKNSETGAVEIFYAKSGLLNGALGACCGALEPEYVIGNRALQGRAIVYEVDDRGMLESFEPL